MDGQRFDNAARALASATNRRRILRGLLGGGIGTLLTVRLDPRRATSAAGDSTTGGIAEAINAYRKSQGLPEIPVSVELTRVARAHVEDLAANHPEDDCDGVLHSWSDNGNWTGGCYDSSDEDTWPLMWDKPREITDYPGNGFEVAAWADPAITAEEALDVWRDDPPHDDVLLNNGVWADFPWGAIGGWVADGYACAWFGEEPGTPPAAAPAPAQTTACEYGPKQCLSGYVWRLTVPEDLVCVTPDVRDQVADDNAQADERTDPNGPYGPNSCQQGYVWREAYDGDAVCVTPDVRDQTWDDNARAAERRDPACAGNPPSGGAGGSEPCPEGCPDPRQICGPLLGGATGCCFPAGTANVCTIATAEAVCCANPTGGLGAGSVGCEPPTGTCLAP